MRYVGHLVVAGEPLFDARASRWRVPVLARTDRGALQVGEFALDESLRIVSAPSREEMKANLLGALGVSGLVTAGGCNG